MKRIVVFGLPGSGKTTFSIKLGKLLNIPVHHLDKHRFLPGGKKRDRDQFNVIHDQLLKEDAWIIEGCSLKTLEDRFLRADTAFYFKFSRTICLYRALVRSIKYRLSKDKQCVDKHEGCDQVFAWNMITYTWRFEKSKRAKIEHLKKKYPEVGFYTFRRLSEVRDYLLDHT